MNDTDIDSELNAYLGLPDGYKLKKMEAFKLYQYFMSLFPVDKPVHHLSICYYIDKHGDFIENPKNRQDYVVKAIHENMPMSDQFETLKYIEYYNETNGFKDIDNDY